MATNESGGTDKANVGGKGFPVSPGGDRGKPRRRKRRRWLRRVGLVVVLLAVFIFSSPYLISTGAGTKLVMSILNSQVRGRVDIGRLSLSWLGPSELRDLRVTDPSGRKVLELAKASWPGGIWRAITALEDFDQVSIDDSHAVLHLTKDGGVSLAKALQPRRPRRPRPDKPLPGPIGRLILRNSTVRLVRSDGRAYELHDINGQFNLHTLDEITGNLQVKFADEGSLRCQVALSGLTRQGKFHPEAATGSVSISTDADIDIGPLARFALDEGEIGGKTDLDIDVTFADGKVSATLSTSLKNLHTRQVGAVEIKPIDLSLTAKLAVTAEKITGQAHLSSEAGDLKATFGRRRDDRPVTPTPQQIVSAAMTGEDVAMADFNFAASGTVDLRALARAVPALMKVRPDVEVVSGKFNIHKLSLAGGPAPAASGSIELTDLVARRANRTIHCQPIRADFDAILEAGTGLRVRRGVLASGFGRLEAVGTPRKMQSHFQADLAKLQDQLGEIFQLGEGKLTGKVSGELALARSQDSRVDLAVMATAESLGYRSKDRRIDVRSGKLTHSGYLLLADGKATRYVTGETKVNLDGRVLAAATGWYDLRQEAFHGDIELTRADLAYVLDNLVVQEGETKRRIAGRLHLETVVDRASADGPIVSSGTGQIDNLIVGEGEGQIREKKVAFSFDTEVNEKRETIALRRVDVDSELIAGRLSGTVSQYKTTRVLDLAGKYTLNWDRITTLLHELKPKTVETVAFTGRTDSSFDIIGPANQVGVRPAFRGLNAAGDVGWTSGLVYGLSLGKATLHPALSDGQIALPLTEIDASGGKLRLGAVVDFRSAEPTLRMPGNVKVLEKVQIDRQFAQQFLGRINPIFASLAEAEGLVSLELEDLTLPLGKGLKTGGSGRGYLDLTELKVTPGGLMEQLLRLGGGGLERREEVRVDGVDFLIRDGRIEYDNFVVHYGESFDMKFYGSVGLDETLDLVVSLPLSEAMFQRFGVGGPIMDYVRILSGTRVDIPIAGTRLNPRLDFSKVDIRPIIQRAVRALLRERAAGQIGDILGRPKPATPKADDKDQPTTRPKGRSDREDLGEIILDILRETLDKKKDKPKGQ